MSLLFFDLLQYFFEGRFHLPLTLYAFLLLFLRIRQDCFGPCSFDGEDVTLFHAKGLLHANDLFLLPISMLSVPSLLSLHWLFALFNSPFTVALLAQVDCVDCTFFLRRNGRKLEVLEALLTAFLVTQAQTKLTATHLPHLAQSRSPQPESCPHISVGPEA